MTSRARLATAAALGLVLLGPSSASAHLASTGLGPFYDGLAHLFVTPVDLMAVLAVAMLAGLNGARSGRWALLGVTVAWWIGGMLGLLLGADVTSWAPFVAAVPLIMGLAVALDLRLPLTATTSAAWLVGAGFGLLNGLSLAAGGSGSLPLFGILTGVLLSLTLTAAVTIRVTEGPGWRRIAVRVAGSWMSAISLLMIGWALKPG